MDSRIESIFKKIGIGFVGWFAFIGLAVHLLWIISVSYSAIREDIMSDTNLVEIVGRLGSDPDEHRSDSGLVVAEMSIAINHSWKDKRTGKWRKQADWHQVSAFGKCAEWCISELKKGSLVRVFGRLQTDFVEDKYGQKQYYTKIIAEVIDRE